MRKNYFALGSLLFGILFGFASADAATTRSEEYMPEATLIYPSGNPYVTYIAYMDLGWNYEEIELTNPDETPNEYGYTPSATPATLTIEGIEGEFNLYPYVYETYIGYEETPDGDYEYIYGYVLSVDFASDKVLEQAGLSDYPYGTYTFTFPEGLVKNVLGELNPRQIIKLYYMETPDYETETFNPPAIDENWQAIDYTADELKEVSLTWDMPITMNENSLPATVRQYSFIEETPKTPFIYGENVVLNEDKDALIFNLSTLPVGRWTIELPVGYVFLGEDRNMINGNVMATYTITTVSGVSAIEKDVNGKWIVYDLSGKLVLDSNLESELKNLNPGLYIINGEKVPIRH